VAIEGCIADEFGQSLPMRYSHQSTPKVEMVPWMPFQNRPHRANQKMEICYAKYPTVSPIALHVGRSLVSSSTALIRAELIWVAGPLTCVAPTKHPIGRVNYPGPGQCSLYRAQRYGPRNVNSIEEMQQQWSVEVLALGRMLPSLLTCRYEPVLR